MQVRANRRNRRRSRATKAYAALECLEKRSLLTMMSSTPKDFLAEDVSQFGGGDALVINKDIFLGAEFDTGNQTFGGFVDVFGLQSGAKADVRLHGRAGFDLGFFINSGSVDASFDDVAVEQEFGDPLSTGEVVRIATEQQLLGSGSFETVSPTLGAYADLVFELAGRTKLNAKLLESGNGLTVGGPFTVADIDQELFAFNRDNDRQVRVLGQSVNPADELKISLPVSKVPPVSLELVGSPIPDQLGMTETVNVVFGDVLNRPKVEQQKEGTKFPELDVGVEVATFSQSIPYIELSDQSLSDGVLSDVSEMNADSLIADMNVHFGQLVNPAFGKFNLSAGPASLTVTPVSFTAGPALHAWQSVSVTPTSSLTYEFDRAARFRLPGGAWQVGSSVTFATALGADTTPDLEVEFDGTPIEVNPTWHFDAQMHNRIAIDVSLLGKLKVGELEFDVDLPKPVKEALGLPASFGPLHQETVSFASTKLDVYNKSFSILSESVRLPSFQIGGNTDPSLRVQSLTETGTNSLRRAIRSANLIDSDEGVGGEASENVIFLGEGIYELSTAIDGGSPDEESGDLDVTDRNLRIVGISPDQTVIDANQIDRVLQVHPGARLTLENLTLTGGAATNSGGGILNDGTLSLINVTVTDNEASGNGGGIANRGELLLEESVVSSNDGSNGGGLWTGTALDDVTIRLTQFEGNAATGSAGGGLYVHDGDVSVDRSALVRNTARAFGGGVFAFGGNLGITASTVSGNRVTNSPTGSGGGVFTTNTAALMLSQSTVTQNRASIAGGLRVLGSGGLAVETSIIAENTADSRSSDDGYVASELINDLGHNLVGQTSSRFPFPVGNGNLRNVSPQLAPLGRYGGLTESHILKPGSPAIDAGSPGTPVDQRDFTAGTGARDIGATQFFTTAAVDTTGDRRGLTLRSAINVFNVIGGTNTITLGPGVYQLTDLRDGDLDVGDQTLTIIGAGQGQTTIDASAIDDRVFELSNQANVTLRDLTVTGGRLTDISNQNGAGISNRGNLTLERVAVRGNFTDWLGGGIYNFGTLNLESSTIADNNAGDAGGGIYDESSTSLIIRNSTVSGNVVADTRANRNGSTPREARGGGVYLKNGTATVLNSTVSGNQAVGLDVPGQSNGLSEGGGLFIWKANVDIQDSTIHGNTAATSVFWKNFSGDLVQEDSTGGGLYIQRSDGKLIKLTNTILAGNTAAVGPDAFAFRNENSSSTLTSGGFNLFGNIGDLTDPDFDIIASDMAGDTLVPIDPRLGDLADNGGVTMTHLPLANSPAIDVGNTTSNRDQRGVVRPLGSGVDIGAVESDVIFVELPERLSEDDDHPVSADAVGVRSLRQAIEDANLIAGKQTLSLPEGVFVLDLAGSGNASPLTGDLDILDDLEIVGAGAGKTIIDASELGDRAFDVAFGKTLQLSHVTVIGGRVSGAGSEAHGGTIRNNGELQLRNSHLTSGSASGSGGNLWSNGVLTVADSAVTDGSAGLSGGGLAVQGGATIVQVTIAGNTALRGGGLAVIGPASIVSMTSSTVADNAATTRGGGIDVAAGSLTVTATLAARNSAPVGPDVAGTIVSTGNNLFGDSSGMSGQHSSDIANADARLSEERSASHTPFYWLEAGSPAIDAIIPGGSFVGGQDQAGHPRQLGDHIDIGAIESVVVDITNTADGLQTGTLRRAILDANELAGTQQINLGDGTFVLDLTGDGLFAGDLDVTDGLRIVGNGANQTTIDASALNERAFDILTDSNLHLTGVTVIGGMDSMGGVFRSSGSLTLDQVAVTGGRAVRGGAVASLAGGELTLNGSTLHNNTATAEGGAIFNEGLLYASNVTLSGNSADSGGGLHNTGLSRIINATIAENSATTSGGGLATASGATTMVANSIIADNTAPTAPDVSGTFVSGVSNESSAALAGYNIVKNTAGSSGFGRPGDLLGVDPQLGSLSSVGGLSVPTHSPAADSPARDSGRAAWEWVLDGDTKRVEAPVVDQSGYQRSGGVDRGATEYRSNPTILSPDATTREQRPLLSWSPATDAQNYEVWIGNQSTGENPCLRATVADTSFRPAQDLGIGRYNFWVRAVYGGSYGPWTPQYNFSINERVETIDPGRRQATSRPTLTWDAIAGAAHYDVWVDNKSINVSQFIRDQNVTTNSWTPSADMPLGYYQAWVRAVAADGTSADWSRTTSFFVMPAPEVTQGQNNTFDRTPTFAWNPLSGAVEYEVFVRNKNSGETVLYQRNISGTSFTPPTALPDGPYRWWAIGVSAENVRSFWTDPQDIFVGGRTELLNPVGNTSDRTPTFNWRAVDGAQRYDLWVDQVGGQSQIIRRQQLTGTSFTAPSALPTGSYRAWVRAISTSGEVSPWSVAASFAIEDAFAFTSGPGRRNGNDEGAATVPESDDVQLGEQSEVVAVVSEDHDECDEVMMMWARGELTV